ncbi:phosphate ABC transporter ATP-binding protein PstB [Sporosarcina trichiuri]|uniref:phosphate ABC transporter ATP-binding protein PstB n=1 Tax=Sporosarcina trichiuri TaxID=3056445 RepID=UPI0025B28560|nr:phosphate ABC transporter ATP-binding protein PstB [Sporosarcina sp. 0.2-SM1T-5]WJY28267.1 phosphate ABC transporter ATP-binding protein PstB [Sporosarcina sp. 0.2-SM1T-5]
MQAVTLRNPSVPAGAHVTAATGSGREYPKLSTDRLSVFYGSVQAVKEVSLTFRTNTVTALIGPSGCGKSTFLRALNRMNDSIPDCRTEGGVYYDGIQLNRPQVNLLEVRKRIGMVFQRPVPFAKSIYKNVAAGPIRHGERRRAELDRIVEDSLRKAALWDEVKDQLHSSALRLSGGQQQRLCIARALAMRPDVLLLDEPASALDPVSTAKIEELIGRLKQEITIIIVTHNMEQAKRISDETAYFYMGHMVEHGATEQLFNQPLDERTKQYVSGQIG